MIDRGTIDGLARISARANDVLQAYRPGFEPAAPGVAMPSRPVPSLDPLSVAAPEGTYFLSAGAGAGAGGAARYSRDGSFHFEDGTLVAATGGPVLGFPAGNSHGRLGPLVVDAVDRALGRVGDERIEADGTLTYTRSAVDPRSGAARSERVIVGRLALARFPAGSLPVRIDATHVAAPAGVMPAVGVAADGTFPKLAVFARDVGKLDLIAGLQRLQEAYQSFEAMRAAHSVRGSVDKTIMDLVK